MRSLAVLASDATGVARQESRCHGERNPLANSPLSPSGLQGGKYAIDVETRESMRCMGK